MISRKSSVLVVDDDRRMLRMMQNILEIEGYDVLKVTEGESAINTFIEEVPELILLDIMMPGMDGYTVCQQIRQFSQVPIIMVSARGDDNEKVKGFNTGADDYITKPFSSRELVARIKAVMYRTKFREESYEPVFSSGNLIIDFTRLCVTLDGQEIKLTAIEYRLLAYLARNACRVLTPDQIIERVWGEGYLGGYHLLRVNIARLRQKIKDNPYGDGRYKQKKDAPYPGPLVRHKPERSAGILNVGQIKKTRNNNCGMVQGQIFQDQCFGYLVQYNDGPCNDRKFRIFVFN